MPSIVIVNCSSLETWRSSHKNTRLPLQELSCRLTHYMVFRWIRWTPTFVQRTVDLCANYQPDTGKKQVGKE